MKRNSLTLIISVFALWCFNLNAGNGLAEQSLVIDAINVVEPFSQLIIAGEFGSDPGVSKRNVTVGGVSVNITKWEESLIECELPLTGPGSSGDVVVSSGTNKSNTRKLVEWRGRTTHTIRGEGTLECVITGSLRFRGDPESLEWRRELAGQEAWMTETKDSTLTWACNGNNRDVLCPQNTDGYFSWKGSGTFVSGSVSQPSAFWFWIAPDRESREMTFLPVYGIADGLLEEKIDCDNGQLYPSESGPEPIEFEEGLYDNPEEAIIIAEMDDNYNVQAGGRGPIPNQTHPTIAETVEFRWGTFTSTYAPTALKANPKVAATVVRGEVLKLDGSESTGDIKEYKWTFVPKESGAKSEKRTQKKGAETSVVLLSSMDVTLTVTDGKKTDKKTVTVAVLPRPSESWTVPFQLVGEEGPLDAPCPSDKGWTGGANVCADDTDSSILHPHADARGSWSEGYELQQVSDEGGPYDKWWYSKASKLRITRKVLVNKCILENSNIALCTEHFYDANTTRGGDIDNYLHAVREHEKMHAQLIEAALPANDPAKKMEALYDKTENNLKKKLDKEIKNAEKALDNATKDPLQQIWSGTLFVPDKNCNWKSVETDV